MPKNKSHRGLLKRIKLTKSGKVRFNAPNSRHLKSNKTGTEIQSYRKSRYARTGDCRFLKKLLSRGLRSQEQAVADDKARLAAEGKTADGAAIATTGKSTRAARPRRSAAATAAAKAAPTSAPAKTTKPTKSAGATASSKSRPSTKS